MNIQHGHARIIRSSQQWRATVDLGDGKTIEAVGCDPLTAAMYLLNEVAAEARECRRNGRVGRPDQATSK